MNGGNSNYRLQCTLTVFKILLSAPRSQESSSVIKSEVYMFGMAQSPGLWPYLNADPSQIPGALVVPATISLLSYDTSYTIVLFYLVQRAAQALDRCFSPDLKNLRYQILRETKLQLAVADTSHANLQWCWALLLPEYWRGIYMTKT